MNVAELELLGAYANAGYVDIFKDGRHTRLGSFAPDGIVHFTAAGRAFADAAMAATVMAVLTAPDSEPPALPVAPAPAASVLDAVLAG